MDRRGFLRSAVATLAVATGLARIRLDIVEDEQSGVSTGWITPRYFKVVAVSHSTYTGTVQIQIQLQGSDDTWVDMTAAQSLATLQVGDNVRVDFGTAT